MKKLLATLIVAMPLAAMAETWSDVPLIDQMCGKKFASNPDNHPTECLKKCASHGLGIMSSDGSWLKLDDAGNKKAQAALKNVKQKDHVRVNVTGEKSGDEVKVASLELAK
jgi:hypothetical protein